MSTNLLYDSGGMQEVYSKDELIRRIYFARDNKLSESWRNQWLKGVRMHFNIGTNKMDVMYHGVLFSINWH